MSKTQKTEPAARDTAADAYGKSTGVTAIGPDGIETEIDAISKAAEAENDVSLASDAALDGDIQQGEGRRIATAFAMKSFLPDQDWIMKNVVAKGRGTHELVGRIFGTATRAIRKTNDWQGKQLESIALEGTFEAEFKLTGEVRAVSVTFLPRAFALQVEVALASGAEAAHLDVDIGLEATGKTIPYEWTVTSYLEGRAERAMRALRGSRRIGQPALPGLSGPRQAAIAAE